VFLVPLLENENNIGLFLGAMIKESFAKWFD
jgi:hypothetical protein